MSKKIIRIICIMLASLLLCSCGEAVDVPELIAPLSDNRSFRPVSKTAIGNINVETGYVVPNEYCHFFSSVTTIEEILCDVGQYVNEGDVVAIAEGESLKEKKIEIQDDLNLLTAEHEAKLPIDERKIKLLESRRQACLYRNDEEGASQLATEIQKEQENQKYDQELYTYMLSYYQSELADIEEQLKDGTLRAKTSGYVTYVKDTSKNSQANINEAVVVIADYDDTFIELPDVTIANNIFKKYDRKYAIIDGKHVPIEEYEYTTNETVYAKAQQSYPNVRYKTTEPVKLQVGETLVICFVFNSREDVLTIGHDSSYADEGGNYVYVKGKDGSLEKRYIEIGSGDEYYMEVLSGLEEGEEVYYVQEAAKPAFYEEYEVKRSDYIQMTESRIIKQAETLNTAYFAEANGKVEKILCESGQEVKKGDALMLIDTGGGSASILEIENEIKHLKLDYEKSVKECDRQIAEYNVKNVMRLTDMEVGDCFGTLDEHEKESVECERRILQHQAAIAEGQKEINRIEYEDTLKRLQRKADRLKKNNDGTGIISVVAQDDGIVSRIYVEEGNLVEVGGEHSLLMSCTKISNGKAALSFGKNAPVPNLGCKIEISVPEKDEKYTGIGISCVPDKKTYAFTEKDKVYVSNCICENSGYFIVQMDDTEFFDKVNLNDCKVMVETLRVPNVIVVPASMVYSEESKTADKTRYYVWKVENGDLVKQYVIRGTDFDIGDEMNIVILSGVNDGDILANETNTNKSYIDSEAK